MNGKKLLIDYQNIVELKMLIEKKQKKRRNARREKFDSKILECQKQF